MKWDVEVGQTCVCIYTFAPLPPPITPTSGMVQKPATFVPEVIEGGHRCPSNNIFLKLSSALLLTPARDGLPKTILKMPITKGSYDLLMMPSWGGGIHEQRRWARTLLLCLFLCNIKIEFIVLSTSNHFVLEYSVLMCSLFRVLLGNLRFRMPQNAILPLKSIATQVKNLAVTFRLACGCPGFGSRGKGFCRTDFRALEMVYRNRCI